MTKKRQCFFSTSLILIRETCVNSPFPAKNNSSISEIESGFVNTKHGVWKRWLNCVFKLHKFTSCFYVDNLDSSVTQIKKITIYRRPLISFCVPKFLAQDHFILRATDHQKNRLFPTLHHLQLIVILTIQYCQHLFFALVILQEFFYRFFAKCYFVTDPIFTYSFSCLVPLSVFF